MAGLVYRGTLSRLEGLLGRRTGHRIGCKAVVVLKGPEKRSTRLAASKHAREERRLRVQKKR